MTRLFFLAAALCLLSAPAAQAQSGRALAAQMCFGGEEMFVGCTLRSGKRVAFCMPKGAQIDPTGEGDNGPNWRTPRLAFLTYRFGLPGAVELSFPNSRAGSAAKFRYAMVGYSRGGRTAVQFRRGSYTYRFIDYLTARGQGEGHDLRNRLLVFRGGKRIATFRCTGDNQ